MLVLLAVGVRADILHLSDGTQHEGEVVRQNGRYVAFRIWDKAARASMTKIFPARDVVRVVPSRTPEPPPEEPDAGASAGPIPLWHFEQMLREAFELLDDEDPRAALRALQRLARRVPTEELEKIEELCRKNRGLELPELIADTRIECAERVAKDRPLRIRYVTRYEAPALCARLVKRYRKQLARKFDGKSVAGWAETPGAYSSLTPSSKELVAAARNAAGLIGVQLKHDKSLWESRDERRALIELRKELSRLVAAITSIPGYSSLDVKPSEENPADRKLRELAEEQAREAERAAEAAAEAEAARAEAEDAPATEEPAEPQESDDDEAKQ